MNSNLRFDDRNKAIGLADGSIAGQDVGVFQDGLVGRCVLADLEDASPFGELTSVLFVLGATSVQIVQTFRAQRRFIYTERTLVCYWIIHLGWCTRLPSRKGWRHPCLPWCQGRFHAVWEARRRRCHSLLSGRGSRGTRSHQKCSHWVQNRRWREARIRTTFEN